MNQYIKTLIQSAAVFLLPSLVMYIFFSFIMWDTYPPHWDVIIRFACSLFGVSGGIVCVAIYAAYDGKSSPQDEHVPSTIDTISHSIYWHPIASAPADGKCLVAVATEDGYFITQLERDQDGSWIHDGEPTFHKSYYFHPTHWMPLPPEPTV